MELSRQQFERSLQKNQLILSFIGMSNIGKTYWAKKLRGIGFGHIHCDDIIEAKLAPSLKALGYSGIEDVSRWMGQPYDKRFPAHQQKYLSFEKEIMENILAQIKNGKLHNTVIDTTGSVIHTNKKICSRLKKCSLVVYMKATQNMEEEMFHQYIKEPKPVIFGDVFDPKENETRAQTLKRCYRKLLNLRSVLYAKYADVTIPCEAITKNISANQFMTLIKQSL